MKKRNLIAVLMMTAALAAGCGAKADTTTAAPTQAETTQAETTQSETIQSESQKTEEKTESVTGKIEEIKDFMFTIDIFLQNINNYNVERKHAIFRLSVRPVMLLL